MQKIKWKNSAALLLAAFVWGDAFSFLTGLRPVKKKRL